MLCILFTVYRFHNRSGEDSTGIYCKNLNYFVKISCRLRTESWLFWGYLCWCSPISLEKLNQLFFLLESTSCSGWILYLKVSYWVFAESQLGVRTLVCCRIFILISGVVILAAMTLILSPLSLPLPSGTQKRRLECSCSSF